MQHMRLLILKGLFAETRKTRNQKEATSPNSSQKQRTRQHSTLHSRFEDVAEIAPVSPLQLSTVTNSPILSHRTHQPTQPCLQRLYKAHPLSPASNKSTKNSILLVLSFSTNPPSNLIHKSRNMSSATASKQGNLPPRADTVEARRKLSLIDWMLNSEKEKEDDDGARIMWGGEGPDFVETGSSSDED